MLDVPQSLLDERRRTGIDVFDEEWEGELHMVPPPSGEHQLLGGRIFAVLNTLAEARGLLAFYETGLYRVGVERDYRVPDQTYARPEQLSRRGIEGGAPLVVEIRSPGDETYAKLDWYAAQGVGEVVVIEPDTRAVELFSLRGNRFVLVQASAEGVHIASVSVTALTVAGPLLRLSWEAGAAEV